MNTFEFGLAAVMAHSVVYESSREAREAGIPAGWARNDFSPSAPPPRNAAVEGAETLKAQVDLAPQQYAAEAQYRPKYAQLNRQVLQESLNGTGPGDPGYLQMASDIMPQIAAQQRAQATAQRTADIADVSALGPAATEAYRAANPQQRALVDSMNAEAMSGLSAGAGLDPSLRREVTQGVRRGFADRGLGQGPADIYAEAAATGAAGEAMRAARFQRAGQVVGINQATSADPFQAILNRSVNSGAAGQAMGGAAQMGQGGATMFDPFSAYGSDVANTNYNADAAARIAGANNDAAVVAGGLSAY